MRRWAGIKTMAPFGENVIAQSSLEIDRFLTDAEAEIRSIGDSVDTLVSGSSVIVKESGTTVGTIMSTLDFGSGFDVSESPSGEANVTLDYTENKPDHGSQVGGLADDDHTQYILVDGTRAWTGDQGLGGFGFTNVDDMTGATGAFLELVSLATEGGTGEGFRCNWNAGAAISSGDVVWSCGVDDGGGYDEWAKVSYYATIAGPQFDVNEDSSFGASGIGLKGKKVVALWAASSTKMTFRINDGSPIVIDAPSAAEGEWTVAGGRQFYFSNNADLDISGEYSWTFDTDTTKTSGGQFRITKENRTVAQWASNFDGSTTQAAGLTCTTGNIVLSAAGATVDGVDLDDAYLSGGTDVAIADGGTGASTQTAGMDALSPTTTKGDLLVDDGTNVIRLAVGATDDHVLTVDAAEASGLKYAASAGGSSATLSKSVTIIDPTAADDVGLFFTPVAVTVVATHAYRTGGTNVVYNIGHASTRTGTQLDVFSSDITLTSTSGQTNNSGFSDATIPANSYVWLDIPSKSGTVSRFHVTVEYTED